MKVQVKGKIKERVQELLSRYPHLRDDDKKLTSNIWHYECNGDYSKVLDMYANGKLTNAESIRRIRQKLQQDYKHLRGEKWHARHKNEETIRTDLGYNR